MLVSDNNVLDPFSLHTTVLEHFSLNTTTTFILLLLRFAPLPPNIHAFMEAELNLKHRTSKSSDDEDDEEDEFGFFKDHNPIDSVSRIHEPQLAGQRIQSR
ncbi:hypothetical protein KSS87_003622 [Heliosperma pusillum]|nr:hypothetical protein KSS87_003622 [Heliosperma pusillum]